MRSYKRNLSPPDDYRRVTTCDLNHRLQLVTEEAAAPKTVQQGRYVTRTAYLTRPRYCRPTCDGHDCKSVTLSGSTVGAGQMWTCHERSYRGGTRRKDSVFVCEGCQACFLKPPKLPA